MSPEARIYVAGHRGLVGSALVRELVRRGYDSPMVRTRSELDLSEARAVRAFFRETRPEFVFLAAAKVGGILANALYPVDFLRENLLIQLNVLQAAAESGVKRLQFLGSSCIYPREAPQPMKEEHLLTGPLEATNEPYAIAKIAGLKLCAAYRRQLGSDFFSVMPTNLYGPGDDFALETSHVVPALIRKFHDAKVDGRATVEVWGTGTPRREFMHVDDLARACVFLMEQSSPPDLINIGVGKDISISELAELVQDIVGFHGEITFDRTKPDGTPRKLLDVSRLNALGWRAQIPLREGIKGTYQWYCDAAAELEGGRRGAAAAGSE